MNATNGEVRHGAPLKVNGVEHKTRAFVLEIDIYLQDLILMMLDASKGEVQRKLLEAELEDVGIRLNKQPPAISFKVCICICACARLRAYAHK